MDKGMLGTKYVWCNKCHEWRIVYIRTVTRCPYCGADMRGW